MKIICPNCKKEFELEDSAYLEIVNQVKGEVFNAEVNEKIENIKEKYDIKEKSLAQDKENALLKQKNELEEEYRKKEEEQRKAFEELNTKLSITEKELEVYKDFKAKESTKAVGESLEQHCFEAFNIFRNQALQSTNTRIEFGKDNMVSKESGSKGDFIYREFVNDIEVVSIMFEMKNESAETKTKHKNEDFLKELDKDRKEKKCEYAVLVSMLESESEYYNQGIVDASHFFEKMYVVRPQFFIPIISLLRNAAMSNLKAKMDLEEAKQINFDIVSFKEKFEGILNDAHSNYDRAHKKFDSVIEDIDKAIAALTKMKEDLQGTDKNLRIMIDKVEGFSLEKEAKKNPTIKGLLENSK